MKILRILFLFLFFQILYGNDFKIYNGQAEIILIDKNMAGDLKIDNKKSTWITHPTDKNKKISFIIASYYQNQDILVENNLNGQSGIIKFKLIKKNYKKEKISVTKDKAIPPKDALERIKNEREEANKIYQEKSSNFIISEPFEMPINSAVTSEFGTARVFNDIVKSYHSGTDFRAKIGTQIIAANDGIVRISKDRYYAGLSVVLEHGGGVFSQYYHLSQIFVKNGDFIKKGQILGLSGDSGRVNGPHLHFGIMVNGKSVDPLNFIEKFNNIFSEQK